METTHVEVPADRRASGRTTAAIGVAVAAVALVFAFNATDAHSTWFGVFKLIHVSGAVFWVGGGILLTVLALRAERAGDPNEMATITRQAAFVGERPQTTSATRTRSRACRSHGSSRPRRSASG
jgi:hypothetical protein